MLYQLNVKKIVQFRLNLGWSQRKLARKGGISEAMGPHIEKTGRASERTLRAIANALGIKPKEILLNPEEGKIDRVSHNLLEGPLARSIERSSIPMSICDIERHIMLVSQGWLNLWGYSHKSEVLGEQCSHLQWDKEWSNNAYELIKAGDFWVGEIMGKTLTGETIKVIVSGELLRQGDKEPHLILYTFVRPFHMHVYGEKKEYASISTTNDEIS